LPILPDFEKHKPAQCEETHEAQEGEGDEEGEEGGEVGIHFLY